MDSKEVSIGDDLFEWSSGVFTQALDLLQGFGVVLCF